VIITSTDRAFTALGSDVSVDRFARTQSLTYLQQRTNLTDERGANAVADELGDLPLAIAQAASVIALQNLSYDAYLHRLRSLPLEEILPAERSDTYPHGTARAIVLCEPLGERTDAGDREAHRPLAAGPIVIVAVELAAGGAAAALAKRCLRVVLGQLAVARGRPTVSAAASTGRSQPGNRHVSVSSAAISDSSELFPTDCCIMWGP
jgi:hypothetical protein